MDNFNVSDLKGWREKLVISQKRLAELAKISLTTLRQLEFGTHKPQGRTLKKIFEVMKGIESGSLSMEEVKPRRHRRKGGVESVVETAAPVAPAPIARPQQAAMAPAYVPTSTITPTVAPSRGSVPVQLSNLDLELINRVLNMNGREKLALLEKLM